MKLQRDRLRVLCVPYWYPSSCFNRQGGRFVLRENIRAVSLYEDLSILVLRLDDAGSGKTNIRRFEDSGIEVIDISPSSTGSRLFDSLSRRLLWQRGLLMALRSWGRPDVIHGQDMSAFFAGRSASALGIPFVMSQHWSGFHHRIVSRTMKRRCRAAFGRARVILVSSRSGASDLRKYGIKGDLRWLPNSIDTGLFTEEPLRVRNRDLLHISGFSQDERVEDIIAAFSRIRHLYPETVLRFAGGGGWEHRMRELAASMLPLGSFAFHGPLNPAERATLLKNCCGFVYPSLDNFHSCDLLEALACGCPAVTTEYALYPVMGLNDWAITVHPGNIGELSSGMKKLLDGTHGIDLASAREHVHARHSRTAVGRMIHEAHLDAVRG